MPLFSTSFLRRLIWLLVLALGGASCQNARTAFQFRPAPKAPAIAATVTAEASAAPVTTPTAPLQMTPVLPSPAKPPLAKRRLGRARLARRLVTMAASITVTPTRPVAGTHAKPQRPRLRAHHPLAPAENGLGTLFLGVLGIVALLVGLLGLILGGGGFFGLLMALGAVALLIAILEPYLTGAGS